MKIVFITPAPGLRRNPIYRLGGKAYGQSNSITGPLILGGILKRAGHDVEVYEELNGSVNYRKLMDADVFCISCMTSTAPRGYEIADMVHEHSHARVIMGGMHISILPEEALKHADQVICGEGEDVILDVVEGRITDSIVHAKPIENLDDVPFPEYSILKTPCKAANIITTRGCPFRCAFCSTSRAFAPYRQRSVDNVIEEIRLYKRMGFRYMNFEDDNFTADKGRAKEICRRIIDEHLQFKETFFFGRTDMARDPELLDLLQKAHLTRVLIGIESLNQDALDAVDKHQNIEDIKAAAAACRDHGIRLIASIVLGLDEDTLEDMDRAVQFALDIDAYQLQPAVLTPLPGTPVYESFSEEGRMVVHKWSNYDFMNVTFMPKNESPWDLQQEFFAASAKFYNFHSAFRIGKLFGVEYGWRRFNIALSAHVGPAAARWSADHIKGCSYWYLKHEMYATPAEAQKCAALPKVAAIGALAEKVAAIPGVVVSATKSAAGTVVDATKSVAGTVADATKAAAGTVADATRAAATTVADATKSAAGTVADATKAAAGTVADATRVAAATVADTTKTAAGVIAEKTGIVTGGSEKSEQRRDDGKMPVCKA